MGGFSSWCRIPGQFSASQWWKQSTKLWLMGISQWIQVKGAAEAIAFITERSKPLAFYVFTTDKTIAQLMVSEVSAGGIVVNDTCLQVCERSQLIQPFLYSSQLNLPRPLSIFNPPCGGITSWIYNHNQNKFHLTNKLDLKNSQETAAHSLWCLLNMLLNSLDFSLSPTVCGSRSAFWRSGWEWNWCLPWQIFLRHIQQPQGSSVQARSWRCICKVPSTHQTQTEDHQELAHWRLLGCHSSPSWLEAVSNEIKGDVRLLFCCKKMQAAGKHPTPTVNKLLCWVSSERTIKSQKEFFVTQMLA